MSEPIDPRPAAIEDRLSGVQRILAITGGKGGIGKSVLASLIGLAAAERHERVGLFDLDFTSPSVHVVLGEDVGFPDEEFGIDPVNVAGISLMSVACFSGETPAPLRGSETTSALLELLAVTRWGDLDLLVIDMPPGLGDTALDVVRLLPDAEFLVVGSGSRVVLASVERALRLLTEIGAPVPGVIDNMHRTGDGVARLAERYGVPLIATVPYEAALEAALGDPAALCATEAFRAIRSVLDRLGL